MCFNTFISRLFKEVLVFKEKEMNTIEGEKTQMGMSQKFKQMIINIWNVAQSLCQKNTNVITKLVFCPDQFGKIMQLDYIKC